MKESLHISHDNKIANLVAMGNNHLADFYFRKGRSDSAATIFQSVIRDNAYQDNWENSFAYAGLAKIALRKQQFRSAATYADLAYRLAIVTEAKWDAAQALDLSHHAYSGIGEYKIAYKRLSLYKKITDSLFNAGKEKQISTLELRSKAAENTALRNEILLLDQQKAIDRLLAIGVVFMLIFGILIAVIFYKRTTYRNQLLLKDLALQAEKNKAFEDDNFRLEQLNRDKDRLLSIVSHDLRSPFSALQTTLMLFKDHDISPEELPDIVEDLSDQVSKASLMLDSLLIWAANQLRGVVTQPVAIDLPLKVEKVISFFKAAADSKQIRIDMERPSLPLIYADADQLRIIIQNLVSNALKFTASGGSISISFVISEQYIDLLIADRGVGMQQAFLNKIITGNEAHISSRGTSNERGVGLGLQLVKDFAIQNNILLSATSEPGMGTTFILSFPLPRSK
ncbi:HAMP domain-containing histidine kinase [Mucilaginibacter achroorhodeus]|uniref:histidine kinase n=1 Tax=Mucilaginibacter achroorhodeus TaxID=2599294 RepID=A0A563U5V7_9SPHI|nr:HAMP domain-containing histidine kinase [Mucilaginibacter achroorhodeus]